MNLNELPELNIATQMKIIYNNNDLVDRYKVEKYKELHKELG